MRYSDHWKKVEEENGVQDVSVGDTTGPNKSIWLVRSGGTLARGTGDMYIHYETIHEFNPMPESGFRRIAVRPRGPQTWAVGANGSLWSGSPGTGFKKINIGDRFGPNGVEDVAVDHD